MNDWLDKGPKFNQHIWYILILRAFPRVLIAGLEKAFCQFSLSKDDCDASCFLWVDYINKDCPEMCVQRFTRVVFGISASPFLLNASYIPSNTI